MGTPNTGGEKELHYSVLLSLACRAKLSTAPPGGATPRFWTPTQLYVRHDRCLTVGQRPLGGGFWGGGGGAGEGGSLGGGGVSGTYEQLGMRPWCYPTLSDSSHRPFPQ